MQFRPQLRPDSKVVILARSRKLPTITVGGVTYKWSGAARTYVGPPMSDPGETMGAEDVEMAVVSAPPPAPVKAKKPVAAREIKAEPEDEPDSAKPDFPVDSPPS